MINSKRLEKIISNRDWVKSSNWLLWLYNHTSEYERSKIKADMNKIKNNGNK